MLEFVQRRSREHDLGGAAQDTTFVQLREDEMER